MMSFLTVLSYIATAFIGILLGATGMSIYRTMLVFQIRDRNARKLYKSVSTIIDYVKNNYKMKKQ